MEAALLSPEGEIHPLFFHVCPRCARAVPSSTNEQHCINDGTALLKCCPVCQTRITNPYGKFCAGCGLEFATFVDTSS